MAPDPVHGSTTSDAAADPADHAAPHPADRAAAGFASSDNPDGAPLAGAADPAASGASADPARAADAPDAHTPAIRALAEAGVPHRVVRTAIPSGPEESARLQGIVLGALLRTIVVRRGADDYVFVLVPAGRRFDWPKLRAHLGVTRLSLPDADEAKAVTGYARFAITPLAATHAWPVIADAAMLHHAEVSIGGGVRGINVHLAPSDLIAYTGAEVADVSVIDDVAAGGATAG